MKLNITMNKWFTQFSFVPYTFWVSSILQISGPSKLFLEKHLDILKSSGYYATWSHKNTYICAISVRHPFMYLTARFTAVSKRNVHWVALKQVKYMNPGTFLLRRYRYILLCFYYVATEMYWGGSTSFYADLNYFVEPCLHGIRTGAPRLLKVHLRTPWATEQTYRLWKPIDTSLDICDANVQKS